MYFLLLIIFFILFYFFTKKYNLSLFISLLIFYLITIFNYNYFYLIIPIFISLLFIVFKINIKKYIILFNFIMIFYICSSISELISHKYIMHCDKDSFISKIIKNIPFVNNQYFLTCEKHIQHHKEVEPDMTLNNIKYKESLFMGWNIYLFIALYILICLLIAKFISNYNITYKYLVIIGLIITFIWEYLWNKVHIKMHEHDMDYSIIEGPYDENIFNTNIFKDLLLKNHAYHHLQKGEKKGNYNVIILGADEWFGLNNKKIDNSEYCKTNINDKICK